MSSIWRVVCCVAFFSVTCSALGTQPLPRATPESQGVSSAQLLKFVDQLDADFPGMHSVMVVRRGQVIAEGWWRPYGPEHNHVLYSLSKSFTSTAVGFAVAEGKLAVDDLVMSFFPDSVPETADKNLRAMRVTDLLTMTTGHQDEPPTSPATVSAQSFLAQAVPHLPGTHFKYNTAATFMQSAIVQKVTGQTVLDYLRPRLFTPLGIDQPVWDTNFEGISLGGYGLRVRTEDIAKFGQLYLQQGEWQGQQLLPRAWVAAATSKQVSNGSDPASDWNQGYGYQFWRCRHNAFRGDGAFGQYCIVVPELELVVVITSGVGNMQAVLNVVWEQLLPACGPDTLAADAAAHAQLQAKLQALTVDFPTGTATTPRLSTFEGRTYQFPTNDQHVESLQLDALDEGRVALVMQINGQTQKLVAGFESWELGRAPFAGGRLAELPSEPIAAAYAWEDDHTLVVKLCAYETPFHLEYRCDLAADSVTLSAAANVSFGPTQRPDLRGTHQK